MVKGEYDAPTSVKLTIANNYDPEKMAITVSKDGDPHGLWSIKFSNGSPPLPLQGKYTSQKNAEMAVEKYLTNHRQERKIANRTEK